MLRSRLTVVIAVLAVAAVVAGGIVFVTRSSSPSNTTSNASGVRIGISLGGITPRAAQISLGGHSYPVRAGQGGSREGEVVPGADAGGVAFVRDQAGHVLASAPVWAVPGQPPRAAPATCASTAFDQFLLTPGVAGPNPVGVDLLWSMAGQGQIGRDVAALGRLICAGLQRDPAHLSHPGAAEIAAYEKVYLDYDAELKQLAAQMPPLASSLAGIRSAMAHPRATRTAADPTAGRAQAQVMLTAATRLADAAPGDCADGFSAVDTAAGSTSPLALCSDGRDVDAEDSSAAWAFLYPAPLGSGRNSGLPSLPLSIVPGRTSNFPSIGTILGAVLHDDALAVPETGCSVAGHFGIHLDLCNRIEKSDSEVAALFDLAENGEAKGPAAAGYYAIAWGDGHGDRSVFPAAATPAEEQTEQRYSMNLTFISSVIIPTIGLILDKQLEEDLDPDQLGLLAPVFRELADSSLALGVNGAPRGGVTAELRAVVDTAKTLFGNPELLADIFVAYRLPDFGQVTDEVTKQLIEYLVSLEVPVAGWAALLVRLVKNSAAVTLVLSIAGMFDALTKPSYGSWTPVLTADAARQLPLFTPTATAAPCPVPAQPAAIPPGAPGVPACEWVVSADLDGNGTPDRLVAWQTADRRGAVAYLDDGSVLPLQNGSAEESDATVSWERNYLPGSYGTDQPMAIIQATSSARQQVLLISYFGADGSAAALVGLSADGSLRLVSDGEQRVPDILTALSLGCATQGSSRLFVEGALGRGSAASAGGQRPGYGISRSFFQISASLVMRFVGYQGEIVASAPASDPFGNFCKSSLPAVGTLDPYATSAQQALSGLIAAADDADETRASAFLGGGYVDFSSEQYDPDAWKYLTSTPGVHAGNWADRPVTCFSTLPDSATCKIIGADTEPLYTQEETLGSNWVVTGVEAG